MIESAPPGTALGTDSSAGLGAAYARLLACRGHDIVLVAADKPGLDAVADDIRTAPGGTCRCSPPTWPPPPGWRRWSGGWG